jgi:Smg protein
MLRVLMYLFKNHMKNDCRLKDTPQKLIAELQRIGFEKKAIHKAFNWLAELSILQFNVKVNPPHKNSVRIFSIDERIKMDKKCRSFIIYLQKLGILNPATRELAISQIMQLDCKKVTLGQIRWVILMILFNQPEQRDALLCMEHLVLNDNKETMH